MPAGCMHCYARFSKRPRSRGLHKQRTSFIHNRFSHASPIAPNLEYNCGITEKMDSPTAWLDEQDSPLHVDKWVAPADVRLVKRSNKLWIFWRWAQSAGEEDRDVRAKRPMLEDFVRLHRKTNEEILKYARRWGVLGICAHGLPSSHDPGCSAQPVSDNSPYRRERLALWRHLSKRAASLSFIVEALHESTHTGERLAKRLENHWKAVWPKWLGDDPKRMRWRRTVEGNWSHVASIVNTCLEMGNVRPIMHRSGPSKAGFTLRGNGLFGALAVQMFFTINRTGLALCTGCGSPFIPEKNPTEGRGRFCQRCRADKVPVKLAMRAYRQRQKASK